MHTERDPRLSAIPDIHGHAKGEHKPYAEERPLPLTARMLFLWFFHACRRGFPRFLMVTDHINYLTFEDPASVNLVRRALKLAQAGDLYGAAETANVDVGHAQTVSEGLRRGMRYSIGAEVDNDPRARPDAQNIVDAMRPDGLIRSVHFIPIDHPVHGPNWNWAFDNPEFAALFDHVGTEKTWEGYMAVLLDAIERLPGNIVGHFYVPAVFGHWPDQETLERYEDQLLDAVEPRGMAIEFNTRFLYRSESEEQKQRYLDANRRLLRKAKERGIGIAIGSDAHSPKDQAAAFDTVLAVLDELDINEIVFPIGGRLLRVALRYVKPAEPEPPPAPPAPPPRPEPVVAAVAAPADLPAVPSEPVEPVPAAAKPVRKARAGASSARPKETLPERTDARHADEAPFEPPAAATDAATPPAAAAPEPVPAPAPAPVTAKKPAAKKAKAAAPASPPEPEPEPVSSVVVPAPEPIAAPAPAPAPPPAPVIAKKTPKAPVRPAAKAAPKPVAKPAAKAAKAPKPATSTAKPLAVHAPAKSAAKTAAKAKPAAKAAPHAKAPAKKVAAKAAPAKRATRAAAKPAPAKKAAAKKAPAKKPARPAAKAPVKKTASKKPARDAGKRVPAKKTPPRKPAAKKAPVKKSAGKRK